MTDHLRSKSKQEKNKKNGNFYAKSVFEKIDFSFGINLKMTLSK